MKCLRKGFDMYCVPIHSYISDGMVLNFYEILTANAYFMLDLFDMALLIKIPCYPHQMTVTVQFPYIEYDILAIH